MLRLLRYMASREQSEFGFWMLLDCMIRKSGVLQSDIAMICNDGI